MSSIMKEGESFLMWSLKSDVNKGMTLGIYKTYVWKQWLEVAALEFYINLVNIYWALC